MIESLVAGLKIVFRNRANVFWGFAFPMLFVLAFSFFKTGTRLEIRTAVIAPPTGAAAELASQLEESLADSPSFRLLAGSPYTPESAEEAVRNDELDLAILIESVDPTETHGGDNPRAATGDATERIGLRVIFDDGEVTKKDVALGFVGSFVDRANLQRAGIVAGNEWVSTQHQPVNARTVNFFDFTLAGFIAYGVASVSVIGMSSALASYRSDGILKRLAATPISPIRFVVANVVARFVQSGFQVLVILGFALLLGAHVYGNPVWALIVVGVGNVAFLNIGLVLAGWLRGGPEAASAAGTAITLPMFIMSGAFFPVSALPTPVRLLAWAAPLTPMVEGTRKVLIEGLAIDRVLGNLLLISAWVAVSTIFGVLGVRRLLRIE